MQKLIKDEVLQYRNPDIHQAVIEKEVEYKNILNRVSENWKKL